MKKIICFGDSNTFGLIPNTDKRYDIETRWTGICKSKLLPMGYEIIEEGLCGRTTVFDDTKRMGLNGSKSLPMILDKYQKIDYVILMLGTNDCKSANNPTREKIGNGIGTLIKQIKSFNSSIKILLISPIYLGELIGESDYDSEFNYNSLKVSEELKYEYKQIAKDENCYFLAASDFATPSDNDMQHLDEKGHRSLALAIFDMIKIMVENE